LLLSFVRVGCFLGGCCYGLPSRIGVHYPDACFVAHSGGCRAYRPGNNPETRVFPIQLVEVLANVALFAALTWRLSVTQVFNGQTLLLYLIGYGSYRFIADFFRRASSRSRIGVFSEAQWVATTVVSISAGILLA
jgi:phosphatidylglycerol:prolipoprotein diacylglycerol transferase